MARDPDYLTVQEAALATGLSEKAVRRRVERGTLPSVVQGTRRVIPREALVSAGYPGSAVPVDTEAIAHLQETVDALARRMDALEVWVLRSLQEIKR